jgi:hypothetical protein
MTPVTADCLENQLLAALTAEESVCRSSWALTRLRERRQRSFTHSSVFASGGR